MIEILTILLTSLQAWYVLGPEHWAQMDKVTAVAKSPYFTGKTVTEGNWYFYPNKKSEYSNKGYYTRKSTYLFEGKDYDGQECKIFIENNDNVTATYNHPNVITDCLALDVLNSGDLISKLENNTLHIYKPLTQVPDSVRKPAKQQGKMEEFTYTATVNEKVLKKRAQVYVPYGYDKDDKTKKYNVLYLMHGWTDNSTSFLKPGLGWLRLIDVLDHLIENGKMDPILVVCPTFYEDDFNITEGSMTDIRFFHLELRKYLIPTVEKAYNTYYTGNGKDDIDNTRDHRAFGGFSMGSACTWFQFYYDFNVASRYIMLSGGINLPNDDDVQQPTNVTGNMISEMIKKSPYPNNFKIYAYTGTNDGAGPGEKETIEELYKHSDLFSPKNVEFGMRIGGEHYYGHINEYLYHSLPLLWEKEIPTEEKKEKGEEEEENVFYIE